MTKPRSAATTLLLAAVLVGCGSGSDSDGSVSLAKVQDTCMAETADSIKTYTDKLTADQFFELSADGDTLRVVTAAPVTNAVTRSEALNAATCVFREAGAPDLLVARLGVPTTGEQTHGWQGFTGTWESDNERGYRARVTAVR